MVTQNHFVIPTMGLEKFRSRGFPNGVTLTADHCTNFLTEINPGHNRAAVGVAIC